MVSPEPDHLATRSFWRRSKRTSVEFSSVRSLDPSHRDEGSPDGTRLGRRHFVEIKDGVPGTERKLVLAQREAV